METIYRDNFVEYLEDKLGNVKVTSKNYIVPCPFCEYGQKKDHYHLYISLDAPIYHCFHAGCGAKGTIKTLLRKIEGYDIAEKFVIKEKIKRSTIKVKSLKQDKFVVPPLNSDKFREKDFYIRRRLKFSNIYTEKIPGLIYDIENFISINQISLNERVLKIKDFLQSNFVGFLTEHHECMVLRNIDSKSDFRYYKLKLKDSIFSDYYCLRGFKKNSNTVVFAEGVFDIFTEYLFDSTDLKKEVALYATALSDNYGELLKSVVFHENIFKPDVIILSDRGINRDYYKKFKNYNSHLIKNLTIYYNENGKDFNDTPIIPVKILID